jgi:hypothetical protein
VRFSSTVPNVVCALGGRPAPDTPLAASTTIPVGSIAPARRKGASASVAAVT